MTPPTYTFSSCALYMTTDWLIWFITLYVILLYGKKIRHFVYFVKSIVEFKCVLGDQNIV